MRTHFGWSALVTILVAAGAIAACGDAADTHNLLGGGGMNGATAGDPGTSGAPAATSGGTSGTATSGGTNSAGTSGGTTSGGTTATDGGKPPPTTVAGAGLPCNISTFLAAKCTGCHADPPVNGSLSGLVTITDLLATAKEDSSKNEAQLSLSRMMNAASPMPPASVANPATAAEITAFQAWIAGNYQGSCDAGAPPPPPVDAFTGAGAFVAQTAGSTHNAGKNCMGGCHNHGFTFAGTLTDGAGNPVAGAEVRLLDANGQGILVHTGANGNFHSSTPWTAPAHVGARTAANKVVMVTPLSAPANGGCNGCHATGGTVVPIHVP